MFFAAFTSRSWCSPHCGQVHSLRFKFFTSLCWYPQFEHNWLDGKVLPTYTIFLPHHFALYSSIPTNFDQLTSAMLLAKRWFFIIPRTRKSSKQITWFSRISLADSLCRKSFRQLTIFSWSSAVLSLALFHRLPPFCLRDNIRCQRINFFFVFSKVFRIGNFLSCRNNGKIFNAKIHANKSIYFLHWLNIHFAQNGYEIFSRWIATYRRWKNSSFDFSWLRKFHPTQLWKFDFLSNHFDGRISFLRVIALAGVRLNMAFFAFETRTVVSLKRII